MSKEISIQWKCKPNIYDGDSSTIIEYLMTNAEDEDEFNTDCEYEIKIAWQIFSNRMCRGSSWVDVTEHNLYRFCKWLMTHYRESDGKCVIER